MTFTYAPPSGTPVLVGWVEPATVIDAVDGDTVSVRYTNGISDVVRFDTLSHRAAPLDRAEWVRKLATLAVPADVAQPLIDYVNRLNQASVENSDAKGFAFRTYLGVDPDATGGGKYLRIVAAKNPELTESRSVHCFVEKTSGKVIKPAGWAGPAKSTGKDTRGQLLSQFTLMDPGPLLKAADVHGGYLYQK